MRVMHLLGFGGTQHTHVSFKYNGTTVNSTVILALTIILADIQHFSDN